MDRLHSRFSHSLSQDWNAANSYLTKKNFMWPIFISPNADAWEPLPSLPGQIRVGVNNIEKLLKPHVENGLASVILFGVINGQKDNRGSPADDVTKNPVLEAIRVIRNTFENLYVACDVCICAYTSHGHCGVLSEDGRIDNQLSTERLGQIALAYAKAGCHCVAPSDMMDGRVKAIKDALFSHNLGHVSVMAYSAKFASAAYGPFRDVADSSPSFGDRRCYQLPAGSKGLAMQAAHRDAREGADIIMVKPGIMYLDVLENIKQELPHHCLAVYHVSGEYCMLHYAAQAGSLDLNKTLLETMVAFRRAGATVILTYYTPLLLTLDLNAN